MTAPSSPSGCCFTRACRAGKRLDAAMVPDQGREAGVFRLPCSRVEYSAAHLPPARRCSCVVDPVKLLCLTAAGCVPTLTRRCVATALALAKNPDTHSPSTLSAPKCIFSYPQKLPDKQYLFRAPAPEVARAWYRILQRACGVTSRGEDWPSAHVPRLSPGPDMRGQVREKRAPERGQALSEDQRRQILQQALDF